MPAQFAFACVWYNVGFGLCSGLMVDLVDCGWGWMWFTFVWVVIVVFLVALGFKLLVLGV